ncbi:MAG: peptide chain release factor 1 [Myxococcales bacterium]|nr:peptide chain release factor 1 [Myxococcales bacterium]
MLALDKLDSLSARFSELEEMLCLPEIVNDSKRYMGLSKERADLQELVATYASFRDAEKRLKEDKVALNDPDLRELAQEEIPELEAEIESLTQKLHLLLLPKDPNDDRNTLLEIRAGAGGEEAALFAADLFRAYTRFAERQGWKLEMMSSSEAQAGGIKEVIVLVSGDRVYSRLRFEGGVHRVQRIPATEAQGRVHTSTVTVAVLPEADDVDVELKDEDIQITIAASGGAGGQKVNRTNSAVQFLHRPTGIIVKSQGERSQHQNKAQAYKVLKARLLELEREAHDAAVAGERRSMVGSGDRAEKVRTYNYPQNRVTDHRIGLTVHNLDAVMNGDLDEIIGALEANRQATLLEQQSNDGR